MNGINRMLWFNDLDAHWEANVYFNKSNSYPFIWVTNAHGPLPHQQHKSLKHAVGQLQQEVTRPKTRLKHSSTMYFATINKEYVLSVAIKVRDRVWSILEYFRYIFFHVLLTMLLKDSDLDSNCGFLVQVVFVLLLF